MTRPLVIRDMRAQQTTLPDPPKHRRHRLPDGFVGGLVLVAFLAAWVVAMLVLGTGCAGAQRRTATEQERCIVLADAWSQEQIAARCETARFEDCPAHDDIMATWEKRARACR